VVYENRLTANYAFGQLTSAVAITDTTLTSAEFATGLPIGLSTAMYVPISLQDPNTRVCEIVWATAHTAASTSATVLRGREGLTARAWPAGTLWAVTPTVRDIVLPVANRAALPSDPHVGLRAFLQDERVVTEWTLGGWQYPSRAAAGVVIATPGVVQAGVAASEATIAKLTTTGVRLRGGCFYELNTAISGQPSAGGESYNIRVRRDTALSGTVVMLWPFITQVAAYTHSRSFSVVYKAPADAPSASFYVSLQRATGAGYFDVNGDRTTSFWVVDRGSEPTVWKET
jgi:hypothetical protein